MTTPRTPTYTERCTFTVKIGHRLRAARLSARMTQDTAAHWAEVARENISDLERNKHSPTLRTLISLADAYGVSVSMLLGDERMTTDGLTRKERAVIELMRGE